MHCMMENPTISNPSTPFGANLTRPYPTAKACCCSRCLCSCALLPLSQIEENKVAIGRSGAIPLLVNLLEYGGFRGKKDASTAMYSICSVKENKIRAVQSGIMKPLVELMADFGSNMVDKSAGPRGVGGGVFGFFVTLCFVFDSKIIIQNRVFARFLGRNWLGNRHTISGVLLRLHRSENIAILSILAIISRYLDENRSDTYLNIHCAKNR
ncbi:hypothetical protein DVH24_026278 [Malus domestica]|uniref:Uncharacterized protein n=1 Tax=Malus domestica TaxID=3750 RepID=A0A498KN66_MALDO|nr:hypothetical protein DVH24_026278 [Malus domestica]